MDYKCDTRSLKHFHPQQLLSTHPLPLKRTKMINTIGPTSQSAGNIQQLIAKGMNVLRLNFSHGDHEGHAKKIQNYKEASKQHPNEYSAIMLDTKGPQVRTGYNLNHQNVLLKKGQMLELTTDYQHLGTSQKIACSYQDIIKSTSVGSKILFADGVISSIVRQIRQHSVVVEILNDGVLGEKKNMCLPGTVISLPTITHQDKQDIIQFGLKHYIHFIAVSFTRYKHDIHNLRKLILENDPIYGPNIHLISKIENYEAILNIDDIIESSDGIMIARGDLGMEVPIEKVVILQKYITEKAIDAGKFVIVATQMIDSMERNPRPTRAQVSDVTNAVLDLADAVMTSGETANGSFPIEAAQCMTSICQQTQNVCLYKQRFMQRRHKFDNTYEDAIKIVEKSFSHNCNFIFISTNQIKIIKQISTLRPKAYICCFTSNQNLIYQTTLNFGVYCFKKQLNNVNQLFNQLKDYFNVNNGKILTVSYDNNSPKVVNYEIVQCNQ